MVQPTVPDGSTSVDGDNSIPLSGCPRGLEACDLCSGTDYYSNVHCVYVIVYMLLKQYDADISNGAENDFLHFTRQCSDII